MSVIDYIFLVLYAVMFIWMLIIVIWRITCFFKKSCKWKKCPYRNSEHLSRQLGWIETGCSKFPPTQEELDEEEKMLDKLEELIEHLKQENSKSD